MSAATEEADGRTRRAAKKRERRRRKVLDAGLRVFAAKGYHQTRVSDIVEEAGIARGTFYLYFDDKRDVFEALVDDFLMRITACVKSIELDPDAPPPVEQLRANIRRVVELALGEPTIVKLALFDATGLDPDLDEKLHGYYEGLRLLIAESLEQGQELGMVREGDRRLMVAIGLGGLKEVLVDAVGAQIDADAGQITDEIMRFLAGGLLA